MSSFTDYQTQLNHKVEQVAALMQPFNVPEMHVFHSPATHYRMRAEFRIWHEGDVLQHIMFDQATKKRIVIDTFPVASQLINDAMQALTPALAATPVLRYKLFQIDYLSTLSGKIIASLLYHKKLDDEWIAAATTLRENLQQQGLDIQLIGRASRQKICLDNDYIDEVLPVAGRDMIYRQVENSFTQPNAQVNIHMLEWAIAATQGAQGDLLELYCGNGNFSLALARNFRRVLATEIAKPSVAAAQYNIEANGIDNVTILRMSAEDFTQAILGVREFNRLKGIDLSDYDCQTVLVDPPRSGLSDEALAMISQYPKILYISCNPVTLADNLKTLTKTHQITEFALFDQFPFTPHIECGVILTRSE